MTVINAGPHIAGPPVQAASNFHTEEWRETAASKDPQHPKMIRINTKGMTSAKNPLRGAGQRYDAEYVTIRDDARMAQANCELEQPRGRIPDMDTYSTRTIPRELAGTSRTVLVDTMI